MWSAIIFTICLALFGVPACWAAEQGTPVDTTVEKKVKIKPTKRAKTSKKTKDAKKNSNTLKTMELEHPVYAPASPPVEESVPDAMRIPSKGEPAPDGMRIPTKGEQTPAGMRVPTKGED